MRSHGNYVYSTDRSRNYLFRRHIRPVEVQVYFGGKRCFTRTLGTSDLKSARRLAFDFEQYTDAKLHEAAEALKNDPLSRDRDLWKGRSAPALSVYEPVSRIDPDLRRLTIGDFKDALRQWVRIEVERLEAIAIETPPLSERQRSDRLDSINQSKVRLRETAGVPAVVDSRTPTHVAELLVTMLGSVGHQISHDDGLLGRFWRIGVELALAVLDGEETLRLVPHADPTDVIAVIEARADDLLGAPVAAPLRMRTITVPSTSSATQKVWRLDTVLVDYMKTYRGAPEAADDVRLYARRFRELNGDLLMEEFTRDHVLAFHTGLTQLPARLPARDRTLTLPEIIEKYASSPSRRLAFKSVEKHHQMLGSVFGHAAKILRVIPFNPFEGATPVAPRFAAPPRRSLTQAEIAVFLDSPVYKGCLSAASPSTRTKSGRTVIRDAVYWTPLLSLFMGLRIEEIAGLLRTDVIERDGMWAISVSPFDEAGNVVKHIKNASSIRTLPLPDTILRLGFLDHVQKAKGERVFDELRLCKKQRWASKLSKDLGKVMTHLGLRDPAITTHSFRHNFRDKMREIGPSDEDSKRLMGHSVGGAHAGYGSAEHMGRWKAVLDRIDYGADAITKLRSNSRRAGGT